MIFLSLGQGRPHLSTVADPGFWIRGVKFQKFRPKPPILCHVTVALHFRPLHEMIEINMKIEICESRAPTLGTLSIISLEVHVDFVNIYY